MARITLPLDDTLLAKVDGARSKQPRVSWVRDAIEEKLAGHPTSILDGSMTPLPPKPEPSKPLLRPTGKRSTWNRPAQDECAHPFRDARNVCRICGNAR